MDDKMEKLSTVYPDIISKVNMKTIIEPDTQCKVCSDTGAKIIPASITGDVDRYTNCDCVLKKMWEHKFEKLKKLSNMEIWQSKTFETYHPKNDKQRNAYNIMKKKLGSYYLYGGYGTGKTHLANASVLMAWEKRIPILCITVPDLLDQIRLSGKDTILELVESIKKIPYAVFDDIGKEKVTDWVEEKMFVIINARYALWENKKSHTVFTSNIPIKMLHEKYDGAIVRRIEDMCIGISTGESVR